MIASVPSNGLAPLGAKAYSRSTLQWRHNDSDGVSNHQPHDCLLKRLFRRRSKKTPKLRVTGLCAGNSPVTGEFPAQRASNAENVMRHSDDQVGCHICKGPSLVTTKYLKLISGNSLIYNLFLQEVVICVVMSGTQRFYHIWINHLCVWFFRGSINMYLHFMPLFHIDTTQVVEILPHVRQGPTYSTLSISYVLMSWRHKEPGTWFNIKMTSYQ